MGNDAGQTKTENFRPVRLRRTAQFFRRTFLPPQPFPDQMEQRFIAVYAKQFATHRRAAALLALITWAIYAGWDIFHATQNPFFRQVWKTVFALRILGGGVLLYCLLRISKNDFLSEHRITKILSFMVISSYAIIAIMMTIIGFPYNYLYYYIGWLLILLFLYGLLRLRARQTFWISVICFVITIVSLPFLGTEGDQIVIAKAVSGLGEERTSTYYFAAALSYLVSFMLVGMAVAVQLERAARDSFSREARRLRVGKDLALANEALQEAQQETAAKTDALLAAKDAVRETAEQQSCDKSRFLASAAHDLRQPMQALSNLLEASVHSFEAGDVDTGTRMLALAREAANVSRSTFNAVLDISRLELGFVEASYSNFDIIELLSEVVSAHGVQASFAGVNVRRRESRRDQPLIVHSDRHLLGRIIGNLVSNAIKYSDSQKADRRAVIVGAVPFANRVRVDVVDNGIGIDRAEWENIFQPFIQLQNKERDRSKGVGLGLSIVQASVALLVGHRLDMTSRPGKGTRFSIELPLAQAGAALTSAIELDATIDATNLAGTYVLYVEDDPLVRQSTAAIFEAYGIHYEAYGSVAELEIGLPSFEMVPDLIITDYRLPDDQTAEQVVDVSCKSLGEKLPVIVMTGEVGLIGQSDWRILHKPVAPHSLLAAISQQLRERAVE